MCRPETIVGDVTKDLFEVDVSIIWWDKRVVGERKPS